MGTWIFSSVYLLTLRWTGFTNMCRNQLNFKKRMVAVLKGMLGQEKDQIGAGSFHFQYAFRRQDDSLECGV